MGHPIFGAAAACADGVELSVYSRPLNPLGGGVTDTAGSGRVVVYSRSPASGSRVGRVVGRGRCYERGQLLHLHHVRFPRALHLLDQRGSGVCGSVACGSVREVADYLHVTPLQRT